MKKEFWQEKLSTTVLNFKPSGIRAFFDIAAQRKDCISLGVGEPDFISPQPIIDASIQGLQEGYTHYTSNQGILSFREEIARYYEEEYDLSYNAKDEVLITVGVSQGLDLALRASLNQGDGVIYGEPSYVSYNPMITLAGGVPQVIHLLAKNKFRIDLVELKNTINKKTKILLLNYPSNPTGASYSREELMLLREVVLKHNLLVISDEIYGEITYDKKHVPFSQLPDMKERTLLLGGFSKGFAMTGFRIAYAIGPKEWVSAITRIHQYSMLSAPTIGQIAAEAALKYSMIDKDKMKEAYQERRDVIVDGFNKIGLPCHLPEGAFYVYPDISSTKLDSMTFATKLLDFANVAVVPGTAFSESGTNHIRCSYATSMQDIKMALQKIEEFVNSLA